MPVRNLDICIISASNLQTVLPDTELFVTASLISGFGYQPQTFNTSSALASTNFTGSAIDSTWNFTLTFDIDDQLHQAELQLILFQIRLDCCYNVQIETIGEASVPIRQFLEATAGIFVDYPISDDSGSLIGEYEFSFILSDGEDNNELTDHPRRPFPRRIGGFPTPSRWWVIVLVLLLMSGQLQEILVKLRDLVIDAISLVIAGFVFVGFLAFLPDLVRRIYAVGLNKMEGVPPA